MKTKRRTLIYALAGTIVVLIAIRFLVSGEVEIDRVKWSCEGLDCRVRFTIENKTSETLTRKIRISATRQKDIGKGAVVSDDLGETTFTLQLDPREERIVEETLRLIGNYRPTIVNVTQWVAN